LIYLACWLPFAACYTLILLLSGRPMSVADALSGGGTNSLLAALLGAPLLFVMRRGLTRTWSRRRLTSIVAFAVVLYAAAWTAVVTLSVVYFAPADAVAMYLRWGMWWQFVTGVLLGGAIVGVVALLHNAKRLREEEARAARAEASRVRAELGALRAQLQPHFLFNALHSIAAVLRADPRGAERALEQLGAMLRYTLGIERDERDDVTLADELDFVRAYLNIEQLRLGDRLRVVEQIDPEALDCALLALTLHPLVENAVRHGIAPRPAGGRLRIAAALEGDTLHVVVEDDGGGATEGQLRSARGVGIRSVRQRLQARHGGAASLGIETAAGKGFRAVLTLPATAAAPPRAVPRPTQLASVP
jgi:sensor histidine kinase YesM